MPWLQRSCFSMHYRFRSKARALSLGMVVALAVACGGSGPPRKVTVSQGSTLRSTSDSLHAAGLLRFPAMFRAYVKVTGRDRQLKPGTYLIQPGASWSSMLATLTSGRGVLPTITIPEGYSISWITPQLAKVLMVPEDSVNAAVRDTALLHSLDVPTETLEGYLFPDTYSFAPGTSARHAVTDMVHRFQQKWRPQWDVRAESLRMSRHDAMTLASIVEKEARLPEERPVIAAVYLNRLKAGMLLQADPTVQYALGRHTSRVLYKDLETASPYNTYKHVGLPPGPIGSPGAPSIDAAVNPANVPYLYFVAYRDGHHEFRRTFAEHLEAIRVLKRSGDSLRADSTARVAATSKAAAPPTVAPTKKVATAKPKVATKRAGAKPRHPTRTR